MDERFRKGFKNDLKDKQGREEGGHSELLEDKVNAEEADLNGCILRTAETVRRRYYRSG